MKKKYSIAIYPSQDIIDLVKTMKGHLKSKIKWYNSCNSTAHITICEFELDDSELEKLKQKLSQICDTFTPFQVYLDHFGSFNPAGAFFIGPNEESGKKLENIMIKTQTALRSFKITKSSNNPHMTIGRKLSPEKIEIAKDLFTTIESDFLCREIVLRELDLIKEQYVVIETFPFGSNPQPELIQGSLF